MLMDGFLVVTAALEPHLLFLPAAAPAAPPVSDSTAVPPAAASAPVGGDVLLPVMGGEGIGYTHESRGNTTYWAGGGEPGLVDDRDEAAYS